MRRIATRLSAAALLVLVPVAGGVAGGVAQAAPAGAPATAAITADDDGGGPVGFPVSSAPPPAGGGYWTTQKMASARPAQIVLGGTAQPSTGQTGQATSLKTRAVKPAVPTVIPPAAPLGDGAGAGATAPAPDGGASILAAAAVPKPYNNPPDRLNGKVYFTKVDTFGNEVGDFVCSGTSVNSRGLSTVWTAGHCVHGGPGYKLHRNWMFVPAFSSGFNGDQPYGQWHAKELWSILAWINSGNFSYDLGAAVVWKNAGTPLTAKIGGQGIWFGVSSYQDYSSFGYPADYPFDGYLQFRCNSPKVGSDNPAGAGPDTTKINCDMTGGCSGGGWLINIDNNGWGYVNSVNSYRFGADPTTLYGPYHGNAGLALYNAVKDKTG